MTRADAPIWMRPETRPEHEEERMKLDTIVNQPVIEAERFDLRPLRVSDAGLIAHNAGDERVARAPLRMAGARGFPSEERGFPD